MSSSEQSANALIPASAEVVAAYLGNNTTPLSAVPELIRSVHAAFAALGQDEVQEPATRQKPAVPISRSVQDDYLVCLEDGTKLKMLKRYLARRFGMSPDDYRRKWGLPSDYPMVAPAYAAKRSDYAKQIGLGRGVRRK